MADRTEISWTDSTFNPWIGCQKVSPGCDLCYAEALAKRRGWVAWGPQEERKRTGEAYWRRPLAWNREAQETGQRRRVFCASLADVFDNQAPEDAREDLWELMSATPFLDWQLLTKRPQNFAQYLPQGWPQGFPNVWLGISAENQEEYDRRWPLLAQAPAPVRFVSYEPALASISISGHEKKPDWLIWGGESGPGAREMEPQWAREITNECLELHVPVFGKQWGAYANNPLVKEKGLTIDQAKAKDPTSNGKGGALLDNVLYRQLPRPDQKG